VLRPWTLVLGWSTAGASTPGMSAQQAGEVGIERALGAWRARLMVGAGWSTTQAERSTLHQTELRVPVALVGTFNVSLATVGLGAEVRPRFVWQSITNDEDTGSLGQPIPDQNAFMLAAGPLVSVTFPVRDRFTVGLEGWWGWEWAPDQNGDVGSTTLGQVSVRVGWKL
jgi:hypothetical protein